MSPTTNPTTPPEPQAGATPDGHKMREDALAKWLGESPGRAFDRSPAFRAGYDACMAVMADSVIRLTEMRVEAETAIAALATSRAETAKEKERADFAWKNTREIDAVRIKAESARDTALARVRELEDDGRRLDWLEERAHGITYDKPYSSILMHMDTSVMNVRAAIDKVAAARAAGTGEEGQ